MYTIDENHFCYIDKNTGIKNELNPNEGALLIADEIIKNFNHTVGPNTVVNDEEVLRMVPLIYNNTKYLSEITLTSIFIKLLETVEVYVSGRDLACAYKIVRLCYKLSKDLIVNYGSCDVIYAMTIFSKERLFELYLIDRQYYRAMAAAFYLEMEIESYAVWHGFFDARHVFDSQNAIGPYEKAIDTDHVVIAEFFAGIGLQMHENGLDIKYVDEYTRICSLAKRFWDISYNVISKKFYVSNFDYSHLYDDAMLGEGSNDGFFEKWYGLAFVIADTKSWFKKQKMVAVSRGCTNWNNIIDRRKTLTSTKIGIAIVVAIMLFIVVNVISFKSVFAVIVALIIFAFAEAWIMRLDDKQREKITRDLIINSELYSIQLAAQKGVWYEPVYLKSLGNYYYHNYYI